MNITCKASRANRVILPALLMLSWKDPGASFAGFISAAQAAAQAFKRLQHAAAQAVMKPIAVEGGTNDEMRHKIGGTLRKRVAPFSRWRLRPCCSGPFFIPTTPPKEESGGSPVALPRLEALLRLLSARLTGAEHPGPAQQQLKPHRSVDRQPTMLRERERTPSFRPILICTTCEADARS
eukprot:scaffold1781_cov371-Pinguiococcus_pyrenoidosus.AAC.2